MRRLLSVSTPRDLPLAPIAITAALWVMGMPLLASLLVTWGATLWWRSRQAARRAYRPSHW